MSTVARLTSFALALGVLFGGAVAVGGAVGPQRDSTTAPSAGGMKMDAGGAGAAPAPAVRGLAVSDDGLTLELERGTAAQGERFPLAFRVTGPDGQVVRTFDAEDTKRMHVIVVRRDLADFQHLHPAQAPDGTWSVPVSLRDAGVYRVLADFSIGGKPQTLADDLIVDGTVRSRELPAPVTSVDVDGLRVDLVEGAARAGSESDFSFKVTRDDRPVAVQDFLGAKGYLVALRRGDLAYLPVRPDQRRLRFTAALPSIGRFRLFFQFKTDGRVHTAAFTQEVTR